MSTQIQSRPQRSSEYWTKLVRSKPELIPLLTPRQSNYWPHALTPKQHAFLWLTCREAFYGGAAGGGKSEALLMAALQYMDIPGYAAIIFRRTYADLVLPEALMDRAQEWLAPTDARWNDKSKSWVFPSGATLTFGYLDAEKDKYRYQSAAFQYVAFDELTQFSETQYRYLFSRLRRLEGVNVPLRMRSASNPGDQGHEWVKQRFVVEGRKHGRVFVRATLDDNPHLDTVEYRKALDELDPVTRQRLKEGDWDIAIEGNLFKRHWFPVVEERPAGLRLVRYWDLASTEKTATNDPDWTAGALMGSNGGGDYYVADVRREQEGPGAVEALIRQTAEIDGPNVAIWMEQEPGSSGKNTIATYARILAGYNFHGVRSTGSKVERANPVSAQAEAGNIKLVQGPWLGDYLDEICAFPESGHDDQVDATSGAFGQLVGAPRMATVQLVEPERI